MMDIVTVVFESELEVLRLQARSIDLYAQQLNVNEIFVIVNDTTEINQRIDSQWWGGMADRVRVVNRDRWTYSWTPNGWVSQQVLKLLGASESQATWCMILDAKTILVQPLEYDQVIDPQGRCCFGIHQVIEVFQPAADIAGELFGITVAETAGPSGVPFFMEPTHVRQLFAHVRHATNQDLPVWFQEKGMITEFVLYSAWIKYATGDLATRYSSQKYFPCNVCHSQVDQFDRLFQQMQDLNTITVSVHRNAWTQLTGKQQHQYQDFLRSRGIA